MAITVTARGTGSGALGGTSFTFSPASNFAAGAMAVLCIAYDNTGTGGADPFSAISDNKGNTWTSRVAALRDPRNVDEGTVLRIFTTPQDAGALITSDLVTVSFGAFSVGMKAATLWEVAVDSGNVASYVTGASATGASATPSITTSSITNGNTVIAACGREANGTRTDDADTSDGNWSASQNVGVGVTTGGQEIIAQSKVVTATATQTYNPTFGGASADFCIGWAEITQVPATTGTGWIGGGWN